MGINNIEADLFKILASAHTHPKKLKIEKKKDGYYFACPVCGDSERDVSKKRGRIITTKAEPYFYCHHECGGMSIDKFYKHFGMQYEADLFQFFQQAQPIKKQYRYDVKEMAMHEVARLAVDVKHVMETFGLVQINKDSPVYEYLQSRNCEHLVDYMAYAPLWKRLIIFNTLEEPMLARRWSVDGEYFELDMKVLGFQARDLTGKSSNKYLTYSLEKIRGEAGFSWNPKEGTEDLVRLVCNTYYSTRINPYRPMIVVEGPIDALLIPNAMALTGASKRLDKIDQNPLAQYIFDNDPTGIKKQTQKWQESPDTTKVFNWAKLMKQIGNDKVKDINDVWSHCIKTNQEMPNLYQYFS